MALSDAEVIEAVDRAAGRSAAAVHREMKRGLSSLATIVSVAPFLGVLGTILGISGVFVGFDGAKSYWVAFIARTVSRSLVPAALGLLVAIPTSWCYKYLTSRLEAFDLEMENARARLVNYISVYLSLRSA